MEKYHSDVQALLSDINGSYVEEQLAQPNFPYWRPTSNTYRPQAGHLEQDHNSPARSVSHQPLYNEQTSTPFGDCSRAVQDDLGPDRYGKLKAFSLVGR